MTNTICRKDRGWETGADGIIRCRGRIRKCGIDNRPCRPDPGCSTRRRPFTAAQARLVVYGILAWDKANQVQQLTEAEKFRDKVRAMKNEMEGRK